MSLARTTLPRRICRASGLRRAAVLVSTIALSSCGDLFTPRQHGEGGPGVQLTPTMRAALVSPSSQALELRFERTGGQERVQSIQGDIRFDPKRYHVVSVTGAPGASFTWHMAEPGRIRFAGVAVEGMDNVGVLLRFEKGPVFRAADFRLSVEEAVLRSDVRSASFVRAGEPRSDAPARSVSVSRAEPGAPAGAPARAIQEAWEQRGDVNGDGSMNALDALAVLTHVVGKPLPESYAPQTQGDVSRNGAVTAEDALLILEYRVGRDRVVSVTIQTQPGQVDVADSIPLRALMRGIRGEPIQGELHWTCPDTTLVTQCGPSFFRPRLVPLASAQPVRLVAVASHAADTLDTSVYEEAMGALEVRLLPYPAGVHSSLPLSQDSQSVRVMTGGVTSVLAIAWTVPVNGSSQGRFSRPFRLVVADTSIFTASVGELRRGGTELRITGRKPGESVLTVSVNGASVPVRVVVASPVATSCTASSALSLDLALGEIHTFRGTDASAPRCLDFRAARDRGRQYLVLTYLLPYSTGQRPNSALAMFDFEGQALFYGSGEALPASHPVLRFYTPDLQPSALRLNSALQARLQANEAEAAVGWRVGGKLLREGGARRTAAIHSIRTARRPHGAPVGSISLSVSAGGSTVVAVGDTLVSSIFARLDRGVQTSDGGPASDRAVITYVGANLVLAEHLDVLLGRLIAADGSTAKPIPTAEHAKLDSAYAGPKRQLDRLFGGPYVGTVAGRNGGGRDLAVNTPLQSGVWGYAYSDLTTINYWVGSDGTRMTQNQQPRLVAEHLLTHEFTHVRHFQQWTSRDAPVGPWLVEGFADFGTHLGFAARALRSETPSRVGRAVVQRPFGSERELPSMKIFAGNSFFGGYGNSSFFLAYFADHVEAAGGDALSAVREFALSAHSRTAAEDVVRRYLPNLTLTELAARANVARYLELLRSPPCSTCGNVGVVPAALRITSDLPAWTKYLQFDQPAMGTPYTNESDMWPILRPGTSYGGAIRLRTGGSWPIFLDGTDPAGDGQYLFDLSGEPQAVISVVRIR